MRGCRGHSVKQDDYYRLLEQTQPLRQMAGSRFGDELVSDAWHAFLTNRQPARNAVALLWHIAKRRLVDLHRRRQVRQRRFTSLQPGHDMFRRENDPSLCLMRSETSERVHAAVSRLGPKLREVIEAVRLNGETLRSYAERVGIPFETARTREKTAREHLGQMSDLRDLLD